MELQFGGDAALNSASMEGALTVGLTDNNTAQSKQTTEPVLTASDMSALKGLAGSEIDFVSLSHTESPADVHFTRKILASIGLSNVKVGICLSSLVVLYTVYSVYSTCCA